MEFNALDIVQHILNVIVLYIILRAILYKPVRKYMLAREEAMGKKQEEADACLKNAQELKARSEQELKESHLNAQRDADTKLEAARQAAGKILEDAKTEASRIMREGHAVVEQERQKARESMVEEVASLAVELSSRILRREVSKTDNDLLIEEYFRKVG